MKKYKYTQFPFRKYWFWFRDPYDVDGVDFVNFFSYRDVDVPGFKKKKGLTTRIDVRDGEEKVFSRMRKKFILDQAKKGLKNGISVLEDKNFAEFYPMYIHFRRAKGLSKELFSVMKREGILFSAYRNKEMVAGGIFIVDDQYMRAHILASKRMDNLSGKDRELIGQANRMVILEALRYAIKHNISFVDLGGIQPDSDHNSERSLAEFKEAFGGERVYFYFYTKCYSNVLQFLMTVKSKVYAILHI